MPSSLIPLPADEEKNSAAGRGKFLYISFTIDRHPCESMTLHC